MTYTISSINPALKFDNPNICHGIVMFASPRIKTVLTTVKSIKIATDNFDQRVHKLETNITPTKLADSVLNTTTCDMKAGLNIDEAVYDV